MVKNNNEKFEDFMKRARRYKQVTDNNIIRMQNAMHDRGKPLIIMNYPEHDVFTRSAAKGAFFVDNRRTLEKLAPKRYKFFSGDNHHCNNAGYSVIARSVFNCIVENGVIDETSRSQR